MEDLKRCRDPERKKYKIMEKMFEVGAQTWYYYHDFCITEELLQAIRNPEDVDEGTNEGEEWESIWQG